MFRFFFENFMKPAFTVHLRWHWQSYCNWTEMTPIARLFSTEGLGEHQFFSLICMHCNKKVGAMSHRLHPPPLQKILRAPLTPFIATKPRALWDIISFWQGRIKKLSVAMSAVWRQAPMRSRPGAGRDAHGDEFGRGLCFPQGCSMGF